MLSEQKKRTMFFLTFQKKDAAYHLGRLH